MFPTTTPGTQSRPNDLRPGRKKQQPFKSNRQKHGQRHHEDSSSEQDSSNSNYSGSVGRDNELVSGGSTLGHSSSSIQTMEGKSHQRGHQQKMERPHPSQPSSSNNWHAINGAQVGRSEIALMLLAIVCQAVIWRVV